MFLDREAALLGDLCLAAFDFRIVEFLDTAAVDADQMVVVVAGVQFKTALPDSSGVRAGRPARTGSVRDRPSPARYPSPRR